MLPTTTSSPRKSARLFYSTVATIVTLALLLIASPGRAAGSQPSQPLQQGPTTTTNISGTINTVSGGTPTLSSDQPDATCPPNGQCFADMTSGNPFYAFVNRIYQQDLVTGYPCGGPGEPCDSYNRPYYRSVNNVTRQQMAKFIDNARHLPGIDIEESSGNTPIIARNSTGTAIGAYSSSGQALIAESQSQLAIYAQTGDSIAIAGYSTGGTNGVGVSGQGYIGLSGTGYEGVKGTGDTGGYGVWGYDSASPGVYGQSTSSYGVQGSSTSGDGVQGSSTSGTGVHGISSGNSGVYGQSTSGYGVKGTSSNGAGMEGDSTDFIGVHGLSGSYAGVYGDSTTGDAVVGSGNSGDGVHGISGSSNGVEGVSNTGTGVYGTSSSGFAGYFSGNVHVTGTCCDAGAGTYKIDDPLDPTNQYLYNSAVQSPDMMDIYNGNVTTDDKGNATVTLPPYFEALNRDFRYQLTVIGQFAQAMVSSEIKGNSFGIETDKPNVKVSWQVTGIRQDAYANAHRTPAEVAKPADEKGKYLYPTEVGQPASLGVDYQQQQAGQQAKQNKP